jgi:L-fucose isomerase-like protein
MGFELNIPTIKIGIVAVSRDNFHSGLSEQSRNKIYEACSRKQINSYPCKTIVENERDVLIALKEMQDNGCNGLIVALGNFGPEAPETIIAQRFCGPVMYAAVAEDSAERLFDGRRDSFCGMLNCSYNLNLRNINAYIPEYPIGTPEEIADMIERFISLSVVLNGLKDLKIITFGPRPKDFFACNAPIKPLYDLGIEIEENSEMDLLIAFKKHEGDARINGIVEQMQSELSPLKYADTLPRFAQYELTLLDWMEEHKGSRSYVIFANKCWPGFQEEFGFLPCYVHSRLSARGIPVGCETDVYGALSQYIGVCLSNKPTAILDINNAIPSDLYHSEIAGNYDYTLRDMFLGYHCGNTPTSQMAECELKYKINRKDPYAPETGKENNRGTLEGRIKEGKVSFFRLHATAEGKLQAYVAKGEILPIKTKSYGCYAVFGVKEMARFYRHVLLAKHFPHHCAVVFGDYCSLIYELFQHMGITYIGYNHGADELYDTENPFNRG